MHRGERCPTAAHPRFSVRRRASLSAKRHRPPGAPRLLRGSSRLGCPAGRDAVVGVDGDVDCLRRRGSGDVHIHRAVARGHACRRRRTRLTRTIGTWSNHLNDGRSGRDDVDIDTAAARHIRGRAGRRTCRSAGRGCLAAGARLLAGHRRLAARHRGRLSRSGRPGVGRCRGTTAGAGGACRCADRRRRQRSDSPHRLFHALQTAFASGRAGSCDSVPPGYPDKSPPSSSLPARPRGSGATG